MVGKMKEYYINKNSWYEYDGVRYARITHSEAGKLNSVYGVMMNLHSRKFADVKEITQDDFKGFHSYALSYLRHDANGNCITGKDRFGFQDLDSPTVEMNDNQWGVKDGKYCCRANHDEAIWVYARPEDVPEYVKHQFKLGFIKSAYTTETMAALLGALMPLYADLSFKNSSGKVIKSREEAFNKAIDAIIEQRVNHEN